MVQFSSFPWPGVLHAECLRLDCIHRLQPKGNEAWKWGRCPLRHSAGFGFGTAVLPVTLDAECRRAANDCEDAAGSGRCTAESQSSWLTSVRVSAAALSLKDMGPSLLRADI